MPELPAIVLALVSATVVLFVVVGRDRHLRFDATLPAWAFTLCLFTAAGSLYLTWSVGLEADTVAWSQRLFIFPVAALLAFAMWGSPELVKRLRLPCAVSLSVATLLSLWQLAGMADLVPLLGCYQQLSCAMVESGGLRISTPSLAALLTGSAALSLWMWRRW